MKAGEHLTLRRALRKILAIAVQFRERAVSIPEPPPRVTVLCNYAPINQARPENVPPANPAEYVSSASRPHTEVARPEPESKNPQSSQCVQASPLYVK